MKPSELTHREGTEVYVNVYDMVHYNKYGYRIGIGVYHSGVEVLGKEYAFGASPFDRTGVFSMVPKTGLNGTIFRDSIKIGTIMRSPAEIQQIIDNISKEFTGHSYNLLTRNCNHFTDELCIQLCQTGIPRWINRLAFLSKIIRESWYDL
jgi:hypothetical protein